MKSQIISFRLDENTPENAKANRIYAVWRAAGYDNREIMTRALLALDGVPVPLQPTELALQLQQALQDAQNLAEILRRAPPTFQQLTSIAEADASELKPNFKASVKRAARPGFVRQ